MKITLSDQAITWFETQIPLNEGEAIRFFGKTYGKTEVHDGFSVGMELDDPENKENIIASTEIHNRTYFIANEDDWFFSEYDLSIDLDEQFKEPSYHFNLSK